MNDEFFSGFPPVGLIADPAFPTAAETLALVSAGLARFELTSEIPALASWEAARDYARESSSRGGRALVVAGGDALFAGEVAAATVLPVLHVPTGRGSENALNLLWPGPAGETPANEGAHATLAIGEAGARNAALFVVSVLALSDRRLQERWREFRRAQTQTVLAATLPSA